MTKGKYANRATLRRESADVQSEISNYQQAVRRLTAENKRLREELVHEKAGRQEDMRILKAQLAEGLSPELIAMQHKYHEQTGRITQLKASLKRDREMWQKYMRRLRRYLVAEHGLKQMEAHEVAAYLAGDYMAEIIFGDYDPNSPADKWIKKVGDKAAEAISQAQGHVMPVRATTKAAINIGTEDGADEDSP